MEVLRLFCKVSVVTRVMLNCQLFGTASVSYPGVACLALWAITWPGMVFSRVPRVIRSDLVEARSRAGSLPAPRTFPDSGQFLLRDGSANSLPALC